MLIAHWKMLLPTASPVIVVVALVGVVIVPVPEINVHRPVAGDSGVLPAITVLGVLLQICWFAPAFAADALGSKRVIVTWSVVMPFAHGPLLQVHWNTFAPTARPVTVLLGDAGDVIVPLPLTNVHKPVAGKIGVLPLSVAEVAHTCWSGPALAAGLFEL